MGKRSTESLSIVSTLKPKDARLAPPAGLPKKQKQLWQAIVNSQPANWFTVSTAPLLKAYVDAIVLYDRFATEVEKTKSIVIVDDLSKGMDRQAKLMTSIATKLRITNQSRYQPNTAGNKRNNNVEAGGTNRPWE